MKRVRFMGGSGFEGGEVVADAVAVEAKVGIRGGDVELDVGPVVVGFVIDHGGYSLSIVPQWEIRRHGASALCTPSPVL